MNMPTKKYTIRKCGVCLLTGMLLLALATPLSAQKKAKKIVPPSSALECPYTKEDIQGKLNLFNGWVNAWDAAASEKDFKTLYSGWENELQQKKAKEDPRAAKAPLKYALSDLVPSVFVPREDPDDEDEKKDRKKKKKKKKDAEAEEETTDTEAKKAEGSFYYLTLHDFKKHYGSFEIFLKFPHMLDDMQEATLISKDAFINYDKTIKRLEAVVKKLDRVRSNNSNLKEYQVIFEKEFKPALKAAGAAYAKLADAPKITGKPRRLLREKNEQRRANAYIQKVKREERGKQEDQ